MKKGKAESRIALAHALAEYAHFGQTDKAGNPYITHPMAVAAGVEGEDAKIAALLHDTVEDTFVTIRTVRELFGNTVGDAVDCLTRRENEDYFAYVRRAGANPIARKVKLADLAHNMDMSRLPIVTEKDRIRLEKYKKAREILLGQV